MGLPRFVRKKLKSHKPQCSLCKKHFPSWQQLRDHLREHCGTRKPRGFSRPECPCCGKDFRTDHQVLFHLIDLHQRGTLLQHIVAATTHNLFGDT